MKDYSLTIENMALTFALKRGYSLLNNLLLNDIVTSAKCGGKAICGRCRIKISSGIESCNRPLPAEQAVLSDEEIKQGWRLACQTQCIKDIRFYLPDYNKATNS